VNWYKRAKTDILDCDDCSKSTIYEGYMLKDEIWDSVADRNTNLCVDCIEKRLKRKLTKDDFQPIGFNFWEDMRKFKSPQLLNRMGIVK